MGVLKQWLPYVLSGISAGGQYALIAVGYTMVYGILRLINFAHGDIFMVAGLIMVYLSATMPLYFALPVVVILTVALGFAVERCAYKPLRQELEAILYTQTDAAVIYPDGDELTMDRESYASARYAAAFGTSTSKSASATQGVFTGDYHTKAEATSEERTQSAFGSEEPKNAGTKKKRKKIGRLIIGIVAAALLVPVVLCVIGAIPIPAAIHNIFVPQTIPEALREYEEAGTLEKLYENGNLSGYQVVAYREDGELDSVQIFDTAGNCVRNELYNSDGTLLGYVLYEYDSDGNRTKDEYYDSDGILQYYTQNQYDSSEKLLREENYDSNNSLQSYVLYEYDSNGNCTMEDVYNSGSPHQTCVYAYNENGEKVMLQFYEDDKLLYYVDLNDAGEWEYHVVGDTPEE